jgi:serine protease AprX
MHHWVLRLLACVVASVASLTASAAALIDPALQQRIAARSGPHEVIITLKRPADVSALTAVGVRFTALRQLPMAGALLTNAQVQVVRQLPSVVSIYYNARLQYSNYTSGEITGGHYVHDALAV